MGPHRSNGTDRNSGDERTRTLAPGPATALVGVIAVALVVVMAAVVPEGFPLTTDRGPNRIVVPETPVAFGYLMLLLVALALVLATAVRAATLRRRRDKPGFIGGGVIVFLLVVALISSVPQLRRFFGDVMSSLLSAFDLSGPADVEAPAGDGSAPLVEPSRPMGYLVTFLAAMAVGALGLAAYLLFRPERVTAVSEGRSPLVEEIDAGIADLYEIPDPRRAVLACYARMQSAIRRAGVEHHASDTPFELLSKLFARHDIRMHAAKRLTELFETARFSERDIDGSMRREALDALVDVRSQLDASR